MLDEEWAVSVGADKEMIGWNAKTMSKICTIKMFKKEI